MRLLYTDPHTDWFHTLAQSFLAVHGHGSATSQGLIMLHSFNIKMGKRPDVVPEQ
jgi:hypothetical protein